MWQGVKMQLKKFLFCKRRIRRILYSRKVFKHGRKKILLRIQIKACRRDKFLFKGRKNTGNF